MRVYKRKEFLVLPKNTIYAKGIPWMFSDLAIKGASLENDWYALIPTWIEAHDSDEAFDRLQQMLNQGASFPMEDAEGRDGYFDDAAIFLVFEHDDLLKLRGFIDAALARE